MQNRLGAVVLPVFGAAPPGLRTQVSILIRAGLLVVLVNNNSQPQAKQDWPSDVILMENANQFGLAGGLNKGVRMALKQGFSAVTLLDQDSELEAEGVLAMQARVRADVNLVVGPAIWDLDRQCWHTRQQSPRMLITSGTTFTSGTWNAVGPFLDWMEIDYLDHEWCSRARQQGFRLRVMEEVRLEQCFGEHHPNRLAHRLGLQLYSPYRRAISIRNLRWLLRQGHIPIDIRLKESIKMLLKPFCWLIFEASRRRTAWSIWVGIQAPLEQRFPHEQLQRFYQ